MLKLFQIKRILSRFVQINHILNSKHLFLKILTGLVFRFRTNVNSFGASSLRLFSDEKKKNNEKNNKQVDLQKPKVAIDRLNTLLSSMTSDSPSTHASIKKTVIAGRKKQTKKQQEIDSDSDDESKNIVQAAKNVARKLGGNKDITEAELLSKLILHSDQTQEISKDHKSTMNLK